MDLSDNAFQYLLKAACCPYAAGLLMLDFPDAETDAARELIACDLAEVDTSYPARRAVAA